MKPLYCSILGPGGSIDGTPAVGDCWRTAIACILELGPEDVPHFGALSLHEWWPATQDWLKERGLWLLEFDWDKDFDPPAYTLLSGKSPRGDWDHTVVGRGANIVHDPHPSGDGLDGDPKRIALFVATDPFMAYTTPEETSVGSRRPGL